MAAPRSALLLEDVEPPSPLRSRRVRTLAAVTAAEKEEDGDAAGDPVGDPPNTKSAGGRVAPVVAIALEQIIVCSWPFGRHTSEQLMACIETRAAAPKQNAHAQRHACP